MRTLLLAAALGMLATSLTGCASENPARLSATTIRQADLYQIGQIEKTFHESMSKHDIDMMMTQWAPNATLTLGPGKTATGKAQIRKYWLTKSKAFLPTTHWISDTAAYKLRATANGDRGTLTFECHYVDVDSKGVTLTTAADIEVARIDGRWLITSMIGGAAPLRP
jgi:hypothetical protein